MSFRRLISVGVLAASAAVLPALPGQAAPSIGSCPNSDYPTNSSSLSLSVSPRTITFGRSVSTYGELRKNSCPVRGATIRIEMRSVVDGVGFGRWVLVKTATTDRNGLFLTSTTPRTNELLRARFRGAGTTFKPATSSSVLVKVRTAITEAATKAAACKITLTGATKPTKISAKITIQKRGARGHFHGWTKFAGGTTNSRGRYSITKQAVCGRTYNLSALIGKDATNAAGRSRTIFGIKATR